MQFKHPEILYFLFLLIIPILVHLFQLRRFKKEYFTNVQFLKALSIQTRKSSKIKKLLLLFTRLLLLTAFIIAFAQPFFQAKDSNNATNEMYIVLDNSFSMQAKGKNGELLKRAVQDLLESVPENTIFSLITNSESYWNTDIKSLRKDLQNLKYSASAFDPERIISKINSRKSVYQKDIVVITDGLGLSQNQLKNIDVASTYFVIPKVELTNNVSIDSVYIKQSLDEFYEVAVKLSVFGENVKDIPIALYSDNKLVAKTLVKLNKNQKEILFTIAKKEFNGYASITDNSLEYDNQFYFSITKPEKTKVIAIGDADKSGFLSRIYTNDEFTFSNFTVSSLDYNLLQKQNVIVVNELKEIPQALQTTLKSFVDKGGNLIVIPNKETSISDLNTFISNFGNLKFGSVQNADRLVTKINFNHPLYKSVFEKKIDNFQYPNVKVSFSINGISPAALSFEDQGAFLTTIQNPISSVYIFTSALNKENSNFQKSPIIVPTFYNMAQSNTKSGVTEITIGDENPFMIDALLSKDEILSVANSDENFIPIQQILNNKVKLTFNGFPEQAGNFGVFKKQELLRNISFNYPRTESDLTTNTESIFQKFKTADSVESIFDKLQSNRTDNQLWKWFIILTLLFLISELLIQKFVK